MANILINGFSAKSGGGKSIFEDYLSCLAEISNNGSDHYYVVSPNDAAYQKWNQGRVCILAVSSICRKTMFLPLFYLYEVPRIIRSNRIEAVLNFGDIVLPTHIPQVYFFDWSYLVYPESLAWKKMDLANYVQRKIKYHIIRSTLRFATVVIAQIPSMVRRLKRIYGIKKIALVRSPVTLTSMRKTVSRDFGLRGDRKLLLCLANYAPHKNMEILAPLARLLRQKDSEFTIVTTLDPGGSKAARDLLATVRKEGLDDYIVNVGYVEPLHVPALFEQCDALMLPTLLESYGLPFVEAMFNKRTIITSDFDFTRDVCGAAAYYFDPLDERSIYRTICAAFSDEAKRQEKIDLGFRTAIELKDWPHAFAQYHECLMQALAA